MARFKIPMTFGDQKEDLAPAVYTTGDATADVELNVDSAVVLNSGVLVSMLEDLKNRILDSDYPPA